MMFSLIVITSLQLLLLSAYVSADLNDTALGRGFYLHETDLLDEVIAGATIFASLPETCYTTVPKPDVKQVITFFQTSETFYQYVSTGVGLSADLLGPFTLGFTLSANSQSISGSSLQATGNTLDIYALKQATVLSQDCINSQPLSAAFLADLQTLPANQIADPNNPLNWLPYDTFLKKYGSHIVKEINQGSRLQEFTFAQQADNYQETDFQIRSCIDLNYQPEQMKLGVCGNYSEQEKQRVMQLTMSNTLHVKGGTSETRAKLRHNRTAELIEQFLKEGETSPGNVLYKWVPIWDILKARAIAANDTNLPRALNLEAYYKGLLDFGCTFVVQNDVVLRWLQPVGTPDQNPAYACYLAAEGCRDDDDCHLSFPASCFCYGSHCVDSRQVTDPNSKIHEERFIRTDKQGGTHDGVNESCNFPCSCDTSWGNVEKIWPSTLLSVEHEQCLVTKRK